MSTNNRKKLGLVQSRGLGDIIIALPIAHYYHQEGWHIHWPITAQWVPQMQRVAPWVTWLPVEPDSGAFFYDTPLRMLTELGMDDILCLYQALTGHPEFTDQPYFQHTSFDQYKYICAGVPFHHKWRLAECLTRHPDRELALYNQVVPQGQPYVVTHLTASQHTASFDPAIVPPGWAVVPITDQGDLFDWLTVVERAEAVIMTDSSMANLVDQLGIDVDRYFIPIHHIGLTPVHGQYWTWLANPQLPTTSRIFRGA